MTKTFVRVLAVGIALVCAWPAVAQEPTVQLESKGTSGSIAANGQAVTLSNAGGLASVLIQTTGTFNLTWELQCAADSAGTAFDADDEVPVTLVSSSPTPADSVATNAEGLYTANIAGCTAVRVIATTFSSGTMAVVISAITPGGGSGGGGGVASSVSISQGGNTAAVNASSQLSVNCANCTGSGASDIEGSTFTLGTDTVAPMGAYVDETTPTSATEDRMSTPRLTTLRGLHVNPRDAAGAQLFGTAFAGAENIANPTLGGLHAFQYIFDGSTWDRWTGAVTQSGTWNIGSLTTFPDNEPFNVAQFGGTSVVNGGTNGLVGVGGPAAHDAAVSGNPVRIAGTSSAAAPTSVTADSEVVNAWFLRNGAQATVITAAGALIGGDATNGLDVDVTRMPADATELPAAAALADDTANPTVPAVAAHLMCFDGSTWDRCRTTLDATHDGAVSTTGPQIMLEATTDIDAETAVADADAVRARADYLGRQITILGCGRENRLRGYLANTDGNSTALTGMGAQGAGIIIEVYSFIVVNSSSTDVTVDIRDGTAGSVLTTLPAPATTDTLGGSVINLNVPITFTANTAVAMDTSGAASTVYVTAVGCSVK